MAKIVKAPNKDWSHNDHTIFLAGSIDMGKAENWQQRVEYALRGFDDITVYNPRRDDWDSSWVQDISDPQFREQVTWELDHLERASFVAYYFDPNGQAPITLLELGLFAIDNENVIVCCPEGYWRRGNVQVVCDRYNIKLVDNIEEFIDNIFHWADSVSSNL